MGYRNVEKRGIRVRLRACFPRQMAITTQRPICTRKQTMRVLPQVSIRHWLIAVAGLSAVFACFGVTEFVTAAIIDQPHSSFFVDASSMRIVILLVITLAGGTAGFFAGGYAFNAAHLAQANTSVAASQASGIRGAHRQVAGALDRHIERHNWLIGGALGGAGVAFVSAALASRAKKNTRCKTGGSMPTTI
jgi:hypothetical protein